MHNVISLQSDLMIRILKRGRRRGIQVFHLLTLLELDQYFALLKLGAEQDLFAFSDFQCTGSGGFVLACIFDRNFALFAVQNFKRECVRI